MKNRLAPILLIVLSVTRLVADTPTDSRLGAYRASIAQESVQNDAGKTKTDLAALIAEAKLNGIGDENEAALQAFLSQLDTLTKEEMGKVIERLKTASATAENSTREERILDASESQQAIANRLFALANNIAANHAKQSLPQDLRDLLGRQLANLRLTLRLQAPGVVPEPAELARVSANQKSIATRAADIITTMNQLVTKLPAVEAEPIKVSLESFTTNKLIPTTIQAAGAAADNALPAAGRLQARVRDILLAGTQAMADKQTLADKLVGLSETLEHLIAAQIELNEATAGENPDAPTLAGRQIDLADQTGILRTTTPGITKENTATLELARLAMQAAGFTLSQGNTGDTTVSKQAEALAALREARGQVLTQLKTEMERMQKAEKALADAQAQVKDAQAALGNADAAGAGQSLEAAGKSADAATAEGGLPPAADAAVNDAKADLNAASAANAAAAAAAADAAATSSPSDKGDAAGSTEAAGKKLEEAASAVAQAKAALANAASASAAAADEQAAAAAAAAAEAANAASAALNDGTASTDTQAGAATSAADAADGAAAAATKGDAKSAFQKAAASFREAAAAAKAGKPQLAIDAAATGNKIVSDNINAMMIARAASNASGPGAGDMGLNTGFTSSPSGPSAQVLGALKPRDRAAIEQARTAKTPPEFTPLVRQYFKNLADEQNR